MGWLLNLFKKLDVVEVVADKEVIHINDLHDWLLVQYHVLLSRHEFDEELPRYVNQLKGKRWLLECKLDEWEKRISRDKKEELFTLFRDTRLLLDLLTFPEDNPLEYILKINRKLNSPLHKLISTLEKSPFASEFSFILNEEEKEQGIMVNPLLKELIELQSLHNEFERRVTETGLRAIGTLREKEEKINIYTNRLKQLKKIHFHAFERLQAATLKKKEKQIECNQVRENPAFKAIKKKKDQQLALKKQLEDEEQKVVTFFSKLRPLLQLYQGEHQQLISSYLENSLKAFREDEGLSVMHVLQHFKALLQAEKLPLDSEQATVYFFLIDKAQKGHLQQIYQRQISLQRELDNLKIPPSDFAAKVEESEYRLDHFSKQVNKLLEQKNAFNEEIARNQELRLKEKDLFEHLAKMRFEKDIEVKF